MRNLAHFEIITFEAYANSFGSEIIIETYSKNSPFVLCLSCDVTNLTKYSAFKDIWLLGNNVVFLHVKSRKEFKAFMTLICFIDLFVTLALFIFKYLRAIYKY